MEVAQTTPASRPGRLRARWLLGLTAVLLGMLAGGTASAPASPTKPKHHPHKPKADRRPPRISLTVPAEMPADSRGLAHGKIKPSGPRGRVLIEARNSGHWVRVAVGKSRTGAFRVGFVPTPGFSSIVVHAVLVRHGHRVARSRPRAIELSAPLNPTVAKTPVKIPKAYWGAWIGDQLTGTQAPWDMGAVSKFEQMVGKHASLLEFSTPFATCSPAPCVPYAFPTEQMENIRGHGSVPLLSWGSQAVGNVNMSDFQLSDLIAGNYDTYIREFAEAAKKWGHPFFLRFDWEMNGPWFGWGEGANGNLPGEFDIAWRHVHDIFTSVGATNASWVWCPYVHGTAPLESFYPGSEYVDWTCLDGYNWGANPAANYGWKSFRSLYNSAYHEITERVAPGKPMMLGEMASSEYGGSKAAWIEEMFEALNTEYLEVRGLVWFEKLGNGEDWPLETSESALNAFSAGISGSRWLGNTFAKLSGSPIATP